MLGFGLHGFALDGGEHDLAVQEEVPARSAGKGDDLGEQGVNSGVDHEADRNRAKTHIECEKQNVEDCAAQGVGCALERHAAVHREVEYRGNQE